MEDVNTIMKDWEIPIRRGRSCSSGIDQYGEQIPGNMEWVDLPPAVFAPQSDAALLVPGVKSTQSTPTLYWATPTQPIDLQANDVLEVNGVTYTLIGEPERWPLGTVAHLKHLKGQW